PCPTGDYCDATNTCQPGCSADTDCAGQTCIDHVCTGVCSQDQTQCSGNVVQGCSPMGAWQSMATCSGALPVCLNGACVQCARASLQCVANSFEECDSEGSWGPLTACVNQTCVGGLCTGV